MKQQNKKYYKKINPNGSEHKTWGEKKSYSDMNNLLDFLFIYLPNMKNEICFICSSGNNNSIHLLSFKFKSVCT